MNATDASAAILGSLISLLLFAGLYVWTALALSAVFRKSGVEPWQAWVPIPQPTSRTSMPGSSAAPASIFAVSTPVATSSGSSPFSKTP